MLIRTRSLRASRDSDEEGGYREKTLLEHARDGISLVLLSLSEEDGLRYHVKTKNGHPIHECHVTGDEKKLHVTGKASVSFFTMDNRHFDSGIDITYRYDGYISKDTYGQPVIVVEDYEVNGMDVPIKE